LPPAGAAVGLVPALSALNPNASFFFFFRDRFVTVADINLVPPL
jgi:hypothetical protein